MTPSFFGQRLPAGQPCLSHSGLWTGCFPLRPCIQIPSSISATRKSSHPPQWALSACALAIISFLGLGTLAYLFGMSGAVGEMFVLFTVIGFNLFYHTLRSIFAEIGKHGKYPYTIAAFGFALYFMTQIIGIPVADGMDSLGKDGGTVVYVAIFMLSIPLIVLLFHRLHNAYAARQAVSPGVQNEEQSSKSMSSLTLTRREKEIFDLVLQGQLSREIAEVLFVSESTVNWHVANILKKTDVESRAELIERYGGD